MSVQCRPLLVGRFLDVAVSERAIGEHVRVSGRHRLLTQIRANQPVHLLTSDLGHRVAVTARALVLYERPRERSAAADVIGARRRVVFDDVADVGQTVADVVVSTRRAAVTLYKRRVLQPQWPKCDATDRRRRRRWTEEEAKQSCSFTFAAQHL